MATKNAKQEKRIVGPTLNIVRYTTEELLDYIKELFYEEVATSTKMYFQEKIAEEGQIRPRTRYQKRLKRIEDIKFRIKDFEQRKEEEPNEDDKAVYQEGIDILSEKLFYEEHPDIEHQKEEYIKTKDVFASHTFTEFPLKKKLNSLYDDFNAVVMFYDDLTTDEIITKLEKAPTLEEKKQIVKDNVEITHVVIRLATSSKATINLFGLVDEEYSDPTNPQAQVLPIKYSNFQDLTLEDCENIKNNDLAQLVQERIDMTKEDLIIDDEATIKGEKYAIVRSPRTNKQYIRYTCPSTQRVYHNVLEHRYLAQSPYYKKNDVKSYIKSWYNIANLFIELTDEEIARPSISC